MPMLDLNRRNFLTGLVIAPMIVKAENLMAIKGLREYAAMDLGYWVYDPTCNLVVFRARSKILSSSVYLPYFGPPPRRFIT